ncbi:MAG: NAD(P)/FAD-dependent oxidoreductase [Verrucomicrobia bacterium]|nr:NAD(P)/FAD-dependent oxidoreductase [Verrucomicrobiota bacterium]
MEQEYDVIVVGAGAAGLLAAGRAAELGGKVLLLEKMERAGRKLLITGKGRCNITNAAPPCEFFQHIHSNSRFLRHAFARFFTTDIIRLLNAHGCATVVERGARVFPLSNKSADVVGALMQWVNKNQVAISYRHKVASLVIKDGQIDGLKIHTPAGNRVVHAKRIILCTGGKSYPATGSDGDGYRFAASAGHAIEPPRPALVPLETAGDMAPRLQGLSLRNVKAMVWVNGKKAREEFGEMLFTGFGVSGPIILTLSRFIVGELHQHRQVEVAVDLKPALDETKLDHRLLRDLAEFGRSRIDRIARKWLPAAMIPVLLEQTGIAAGKQGHHLTATERRKILLLMKDLRFTITGCRPFKEAIITAGGVLTAEIEAKTMESKLVRNLYFAGELIDLDADTGGFNLQLAFSTGWLAAEACMRRSD